MSQSQNAPIPNLPQNPHNQGGTSKKVLGNLSWPTLCFIGAGVAGLILIATVVLPGLTGTGTGKGTTTSAGAGAGAGASSGAASSSSNTNAGSDPYASYTAQQVMDTFVKAYQTHDWATCQALIAPSVKAGWSTPDQFERQVAQVEREQGDKLTIKTYGAIQGTNTGTEQQYLILYTRSKGTSPGSQSDATITLRAINGTYKISYYTIF